MKIKSKIKKCGKFYIVYCFGIEILKSVFKPSKRKINLILNEVFIPELNYEIALDIEMSLIF